MWPLATRRARRGWRGGSGPAARESRCRSTVAKRFVAWRWDWFRMREAIVQAHGDRGSEGRVGVGVDGSRTRGDLVSEVVELIEDVRVELG